MRGPNIYPQAGARYESFVLTGTAGREELLAIITEQPLPLDWMPRDRRNPARVLNEGDVQQLLSLLKSLPGRSWAALSTYFDVFA